MHRQRTSLFVIVLHSGKMTLKSSSPTLFVRSVVAPWQASIMSSLLFHRPFLQKANALLVVFHCCRSKAFGRPRQRHRGRALRRCSRTNVNRQCTFGIATPGGHSKERRETKEAESTPDGCGMHRRSSSPRMGFALTSRPRHGSIRRPLRRLDRNHILRKQLLLS
jgi:hypothetical protein